MNHCLYMRIYRDPIESAEEAISKLKQAITLLNEVVDELKAVEETEVVK